MMDDTRGTASFMITCAEKGGCAVYFEPLGSGYDLKYGDRVYVRTNALLNGAVEISRVDSGIIVCFTSSDEVVVENKSGEKIQL